MKGLLIKTNGQIIYKYYKDIADLYDNDPDVVDIEQHDTLDGCYMLFGTLYSDENFNNFEFLRSNPCGNVYVLETDGSGNPVNIDTREFLNYYSYCDDLDDTIIQDELFQQNMEYQYNDFVIQDDDMQSFNEYIREHQ